MACQVLIAVPITSRTKTAVIRAADLLALRCLVNSPVLPLRRAVVRPRGAYEQVPVCAGYWTGRSEEKTDLDLDTPAQYVLRSTTIDNRTHARGVRPTGAPGAQFACARRRNDSVRLLCTEELVRSRLPVVPIGQTGP